MRGDRAIMDGWMFYWVDASSGWKNEGIEVLLVLGSPVLHRFL